MTHPKRKHRRTRNVAVELRAVELQQDTEVPGARVNVANVATGEVSERINPPADGTLSADPLGELAPALEATAEPAPDAQAAFASLEPRAEPLGGPGPSSELPPMATDAAPAPAKPGALPPNYQHWGERKTRAKRKPELAARVLELQKIIETRPPPAAVPLSGPISAPPATLDECQDLLARVFPACDAVFVHFGGDVWAATPKEQELLVSTTAPVLFPHYEQLKTRLPWIPAGVAALAVYVPKALAKMRAARDAAGAEEPNGPKVPDADAGDATVYDFPSRQYGGPHQ